MIRAIRLTTVPRHKFCPTIVEKWDSTHAQRPADAFPEFNGEPFRYGSRVLCLVLSPYAKRGHISHQLNSHASLDKFCGTTFGLQPMTDRDKSSNGMADCFDFTQKPEKPPETSYRLP